MGQVGGNSHYLVFLGGCMMIFTVWGYIKLEVDTIQTEILNKKSYWREDYTKDN